jgi:hypothetical protein
MNSLAFDPVTPGTIYVGMDAFRHDAFVVKLDPSVAGLASLVYSTYLGGSGNDTGADIAVDCAGAAYVTGYSNSIKFPTTAGAPQPSWGGGIFIPDRISDTQGLAFSEAFVAKLDPTGSSLVYSTYLGGEGEEGGFGIAIDRTGSAYITGGTNSLNFPTTRGAFQTTFAGNFGYTDINIIGDAFVTKLTPRGSTLAYSTYLGGERSDQGFRIAVDMAGNAYVTGMTFSAYFPTANAIQNEGGSTDPDDFFGITDAFVTRLNANGSVLLFSTYLGGSDGEAGTGIAVDAMGNAYVTGSTGSSAFPTANAFQPDHAGAGDAFIVKIAEPEPPLSLGFWKAHPADWPVSSLILGSQTYTKTDLLAILKTPTGSGGSADASVILARQLIAAKLNIANGSDPSPISSTITDADSLLSGFAGKLPYRVNASSLVGQAMIEDARELDHYNGELSQRKKRQGFSRDECKEKR